MRSLEVRERVAGREDKNWRAISYYTKVISRLSADLGYIISEGTHDVTLNLSNLYLKRAEVYKTEEETNLMCEDF